MCKKTASEKCPNAHIDENGAHTFELLWSSENYYSPPKGPVIVCKRCGEARQVNPIDAD